ncbi:uncharacterized protein F4807DRAFT_431358 [Annulohypoxylon truncatum]|uniref:uncharacterized protein n=1 Tax=Annulohypoxylon truncatum TaxID=327061 RepID=UPI0020074B14|nr:uncharacterized protein F4807DRAFT_431358 [Annulohypoxylon truncatum]KAI1208445.1 hypothetical protein F4807DRAFT_431358 [Annulohypoxylon truncatum]
MVWTKVSDTRWERPVDGLEGYFVVMANLSASLCDGREHYTLFSKVKLETGSEDATPALKHAWKQIRYEQPQVATTVEGMKKVYEVPDEKALEEWLESTFVVSSASDAEELYQSVKPIKQATIYYLPNSSELVFRGHHHTLDGTGVMLFWHSYFEALASPIEDIKFGDEHVRLAPIMEETLGYPEQPTQEQSDKATALFLSWATAMPGIGPVSKLGAAPSGRCQNSELVFPTETTKAIITACKNKGISVSAAVHAAYIGAITKHADPNSKLAEYVTAAQFNLRPYLPEPYSTSKHAVSVYYTPIPYKVNLPTSFLDVAKSLHEYYQTTFKSNPEMLELKGHFTRVLCGAVQTPEFLASPVSKDALVSSLGVAERYVQREYGNGIKVKDIKLGVDVVMGMSMFFFYTFRDQLRLVYSFNDGFEDPENIQKYLEEVQAILVEELLA